MKMNKRWKKLIVMSMFVMVMGFSLGCMKEPGPSDVSNDTQDQQFETRKEFRSDADIMSISATDLWSVDDSLHEGSRLSLYNEEYQSYLIILTDEKKVFAEDTSLVQYGELVYASTMEGLNDGTVSEMDTLQVNGLDARSFTVSGLVDEISVTYKFLVLEDESEFYQVVMWSFSENIEKNAKYYDEILHSFKVLKKVTN